MGFSKIENYNADMAEIIFNEIISTCEIDDKHHNFHFRLVKLDQIIENFRKDLQNKVINDIDNQI